MPEYNVGSIVEIDGRNYQIDKLDTVTVTPKHCLWFAFVIGPINGPHNDVGEDYRPEYRYRESQSVMITVLNPNDDQWSHHPIASQPGWKSGPEGRTDASVNLEDEAYRDQNYQSKHIALPRDSNGDEIKYPLNSLVCMFAGDAAPTENEPAIIQRVGRGTTSPLVGPEGATRLFLGFHDGKEWSNNEGTPMQVQLVWTTDVGK